jgi:hypothetical protein
LIGKEFVLYSDHEVLKFLHNRRRISNNIHAITYLQRFPIRIVYKVEVQNRVVDVLSRRVALLITLRRETIGLRLFGLFIKHYRVFSKFFYSLGL